MTFRSVWELIKAAASSWNEVNAPRLGASLAFYTMLSIAPLLVISIAIAAVAFGPEAAQGRVVGQLQDLIGHEGGEVIQSLLKTANQQSSGLASLVGGLLLLFGASSVVGELRDSLNLVWGAVTSNTGGVTGMIRYRFVSFALVFGIGFLLLVSLLMSAALAAAGNILGGYLPAPEVLLHLVTWLFSFITVTIFFGLLYKVVPDVRVEWRDVWIGAAVTSALFSTGKLLIGLYLGKASVGSVYGAAGSLVVFLVWVYYSAQIFFFGAAFTRSFAERHGSRARPRVPKSQEKVA